MEFASVVDAVCFAVEVQVALRERNAEVPDNRQIVYRMGLNIGDVIIEGEDIYGDGVNVAARLEALAEPGGICISRNVYSQVKGKLDLSFEHLGEKEVKNIAEPVTVYRILLDDKAAALTTPLTVPVPQRDRGRWPQIVAGFVLSVAAVAGLIWWQARPPVVEPASVDRMAFPLPDKPSIAVLPFDNMSGDPDQEYFADGIAEDLITDLSKISGLFVISRTSTFTYKGKATKVHEIAEDLGVRYVLEGSVRRAGNELRINAQLIDATTGGHLWADRYDGTMENIFELQDTITKRIVDALALELTPREVQALDASSTGNVDAHNEYLLGMSYYYRRTPEGFAKAKTHFERAIQLDPDYSAAYAALAKIYAQVEGFPYWMELEVSAVDAILKAREALAKAGTKPNADVHVVQSWLALRKFQQEKAIAEAERALELDPNSVDALEALAKAKIYSGDAKAGLELAERAMRRNPALLPRPVLLKGIAEFAMEDLDKATENIEHAFELGSEEVRYMGILAASYGLLGRKDEAQTAFDAFQQSFANRLDLSRSVVEFQFSDPDVLERLAEGLELAGAKTWFSREDGGYLQLHAANKLDGAEIVTLLSGGKIEGRGISSFRHQWQRLGGADGA
ncbi:MAG: adenylate/guanylate cyclase domain-containing protein, partial [Rhodothermales bacterium]|nr:adenylate/guanylate cyclase domain-containing protein [Rhodothermales bacterium]